MTATIITAAAGFLIAVLWFDLMFDVQVARRRAPDEIPTAQLDSIAAYYRRVTTTASPMGRLVILTMLALLVALVAQAARSDAPVWVSAVSIPTAALGIGIGALRAFGAAQRLGRRRDPPDVQYTLARGILRDHLICLPAMVTLLATQLAGAW